MTQRSVQPSSEGDASSPESHETAQVSHDFFHDFVDFGEGSFVNTAAGDCFIPFETVNCATDLFDFAYGQVEEPQNVVRQQIDDAVTTSVSRLPPNKESRSDAHVALPPSEPSSWTNQFVDHVRQQRDHFRVLWKPSKKPVSTTFAHQVYCTLKYSFSLEFLTNDPLDSCCLAQVQIVHSEDNSKDYTEHIQATSVLLAKASRVPKKYKAHYKHAYQGTVKVSLSGPMLSTYKTKRRYRFRIVCTNETDSQRVLESTSSVFTVFSRKEDKNKGKRKRKQSEVEESNSGDDTKFNSSSCEVDSKSLETSPSRKRRKTYTKSTSPNHLSTFEQKLDEILAFMQTNLEGQEQQKNAWRLLFDSQIKFISPQPTQCR